MKAQILTSLLAFAAISGYAARDPYAGYIYPSGIQPGTTNTFIIGGQNMWGPTTVHFTGKGLRVLGVDKVPGFAPPTGAQRVHLKAWLDGIAAGRLEEPEKPNDPHIDEWRSNSWWRVLGTLDRLRLSIVEEYLFTQRNPLQDTPSLRQMILVSVAAEPDAPAAISSFYVCTGGGMSAPRPFEVHPAPRTAENLYVPPHRNRPAPRHVDVRNGAAMLDGQIMPGSTDAFLLDLSAGRRYAFKVTARELQPYIGDAVPGFFNAVICLRGCAGDVVASADDHMRFRPDPYLEFTPPADGTYSIEIHDVLYRGRADFVYSISVDTAGTGAATQDGGRPPDGRVSRPGEICRHPFTIDSPGPRMIEVAARRRGSPLDAVLTLKRESDGEVLARWDDTTNTVFFGTIPQAECDPQGVYDFKEPGRYVAEIEDRTSHGGADYAWWIDIRRPAPDFEVRSLRSTLPVRRDQPLKVDFAVSRRDGFTGKVWLVSPKGFRISGGVATSGVDRISATFTCTSPTNVPTPSAMVVFACAQINGSKVRREVIPCDEYEQAFAWRHLVPAKSFMYRTTGQPPARRGPKTGAGKRRPQNRQPAKRPRTTPET